MVDEQLRAVQARIPEQPRVAITHFLPDRRKSGGAYVCSEGRVKRIDESSGNLYLTDGRAIPLEMIFRVVMEDACPLAEISGM